MHKIPTIFDRDWDGHRGVVRRYSEDFLRVSLAYSIAEADLWLRRAWPTEKLNGTNIRLTVRREQVVRVEARVNPSKAQKREGIEDPWYRDAEGRLTADRYILEAAENAELDHIYDGEWPAEAVGPKIQGNPYGLDEHRAVVFSSRFQSAQLRLEDVPIDFDELREWLPAQRSHLNPDVPIEGVVWHGLATDVMAKIKTADFR